MGWWFGLAAGVWLMGQDPTRYMAEMKFDLSVY